ncbi:MAG: hypothetical protein HKN72_10795 [Gemmatimonadetes bacterium]|nr:hypothetical protein [Gemmatimonadota bacterium]
MFTSNRSGEGDVFGVARPGDQPVLLVGGPEPEGTVRFDPARNRLIHHRYRNDVVEVVAGSHVLIIDSTDLVEPQWSPSGDVVYALESDGGGRLVIADSTGRSTRRIVEDEAIERYPSWSPSGESVAYAKRLGSGWDLHLFDLTAGIERRLTFDEVYVGHPAWSPDGSRLAFDRMVGEQTEIFAIDLQTLETTRLTERPGMDLAPAWSRDGAFLAFGSGEGSNWDIWLLNVETSGLTRITEHPATDGGPVFVPHDALPAR